MGPLRRVACVSVLLALLASCDGAPERGTHTAGLLIDPDLNEISGLAASRRHRDVLWMHDDGGNPARLFAVDTGGARRATLRVEGVTKTDWEDIAAFRLDGRDYLLVADTGDNGGLRRTLQLHVIEEPARLRNGRVRPAWSIAFRWPDGPRDCEAVAVDAERGEVLLVTKRRTPPELYAVPLRARDGRRQTARRIGTLAGVPQPPAGTRDARERVRGQVTAASLSPDGRRLAVMTYGDLIVYARRGREPWGAAVARAPRGIELPWLPQAEAVGWSADGRSLYATGEFVPAPLYRITP